MLVNQPFYIQGFSEEGALEQGKASIFSAMGIFIFAFFLSLFGIHYDKKQKLYEAEGPEGYQLNQAPAYGSRYD